MSDSTPTPDTELTPTVLAEVLPGVAVVFGPAPEALAADLVRLDLLSDSDREHIATALAAMGNTATTAGNIGNAFSSMQGLYKLSDATKEALAAGGKLAVKDGMNLGTVLSSKGISQARFIPMTMSAVQMAAAIGPALAMISIQMSLGEISGLVKTNIELTKQVLTEARNERWSRLISLVGSIDDAIAESQGSEQIPDAVWGPIESKGTDLTEQRNLFQRNVRHHIEQISGLATRGRREYLETNAETIVFDTMALFSTIKARVGYEGLRAARARAAGNHELVDRIAVRTRAEVTATLTQTEDLVSSLTRELRIVAELPGERTLPGTRKRKDSEATRQAAAALLEAVQPLADALRPPPPPLETPGVVCAPVYLQLGPYLHSLGLLLAHGEYLRALAFPGQSDQQDPVSKIVGAAKDTVSGIGALSKQGDLVIVTDSRIIITKTKRLLARAEADRDIPIDQVRYVRRTTPSGGDGRSAIDLVTRDENIQWTFPSEIQATTVDALAAVLAESMNIPDQERDELQRWRVVALESSTSPGDADESTRLSQ